MAAQHSTILLIEDNDQQRHDLLTVLSFLGEPVLAVDWNSWKSEVDPLDQESILCVIAGSGGGDLEGRVQALIEWDAQLPVIVLGDEKVGETWESLLKHHVIGNLPLPPSYNQFLDCLHRAQIFRQAHLNSAHRSERRELMLFRSLVGGSREVQEVRGMMQQVADNDVTVLVTGESGTGKEVIARNLHYHSCRREKPFVPVNCGAIPPDLLESELFGHEKGAFTGAITGRAGRFEMAEGGTLFLDEIGDMPLNMQVKILRVLQERCFERVGGNKTIKTNVRIIAATHRNLEQMIEDQRFREDLFYRLNVFPIDMPSLRERREDIPLLINELIKRLENDKQGSIRFNSAAMMSLCQHDWPGNVRELANLVERMTIMHPYGVVGVSELPLKYRNVEDPNEESFEELQPLEGQPSMVGMGDTALLPTSGIDLKEYLATLERSLIEQALNDSNSVVARAAERLNIRRTTLVEKMRKHGIDAKKQAS